MSPWKGEAKLCASPHEMERRADKDRTTVERFEQIEGNQAKILGLLHRIDEGADRDPQRRR